MQPRDLRRCGQVQLFGVGLQLPRHMAWTELLRQQHRRAELVQQHAAFGSSQIECPRQFAIGAGRERGGDLCAAERAAQLKTLVGAFSPKGQIRRRKRFSAHSQRAGRGAGRKSREKLRQFGKIRRLEPRLALQTFEIAGPAAGSGQVSAADIVQIQLFQHRRLAAADEMRFDAASVPERPAIARQLDCLRLQRQVEINPRKAKFGRRVEIERRRCEMRDQLSAERRGPAVAA